MRSHSPVFSRMNGSRIAHLARLGALGLSFGGFALVSACSTVARAPAKTEIAELVRLDLTCRAEDGKVCKPEEQPKKILIDTVACRPLPLRAGVPEVSRAECRYAATVIRADGAETKLGSRIAEFGLLNYAPGSRIGVYQWSKKPDRAAPESP